MTLVNTMIYYYMLVQLCLFLLFSLPFPSRIQRVFLAILNSSLAKSFYKLNRWVVFMMILFVTENLRRYFENAKQHDIMEVNNAKGQFDYMRDTQLDAQIFLAERNIYLNVAALTMGAAFNSLAGKIQVICQLKHDKLQKKEAIAKISNAQDNK